MSTRRIAIVEDEESSRERIKKCLQAYMKAKDCKFSASYFESGKKFIEENSLKYDLIFMDIEMPELDGMETARKIRETDSNVEIVFVTNMAQYAIHGYEVGAMDYILKPIQYELFEFIMNKIMKKMDARSKKTIMIQNVNQMRKIDVSEIYFIESEDHHLLYHTKNGVLRQRMPMREAEKELEPYGFYRCNSCYLVNLDYVKSIKEDGIYVNDTILQPSRARKKAFITMVMKHHSEM